MATQMIHRTIVAISILGSYSALSVVATDKSPAPMRNPLDPQQIRRTLSDFGAGEVRTEVVQGQETPVSVNFGISQHMSAKNVDVITQLRPHLREIWLSHSSIDDNGLIALSSLHSLEKVHLFHAKAITDRGVAALLSLSSLKELEAGGTSVTSKAFEKLGTESHLIKLDLWETKIDDTSLRNLKLVPYSLGNFRTLGVLA